MTKVAPPTLGTRGVTREPDRRTGSITTPESPPSRADSVGGAILSRIRSSYLPQMRISRAVAKSKTETMMGVR